MRIQFTYRNHRGNERLRTIDVDSVEFIRNPGFNYQPGWFVSGYDCDKEARRSFALTHIVLPDSETVRFYKLLDFMTEQEEEKNND